MKITWASNAPWAGTGYGMQTKLMIPRLLADGHEVAVAANHGLSGAPMTDPATGVPVFGNVSDTYQNDVLLGYDELFRAGDPGWIITLYDVWVYDPPRFKDARIASWTPVDHYPAPPRVAAWCRDHETIAMSRFGESALREAGVSPHYAPHALDLDVWKPTPSGARAQLGIPDDAFLVMINAANKGNMPPRKAWGEMLSAIALFMRERPDVYVYIHSEQSGTHGGVDIPILMAALDLPPDRFRWPNQLAYLAGLIPQGTLAALYSTADVLLASSMGEGFGIPVIEAQACGTPVIVTNFSAQPELVGAGWTVGYQPWWDFTQGSWFAMPLIAQIVKALHASYEARGDQSLAAAAVAKGAEYEADKVYAEHWRPILASLEAKLDTRPRAERRAKRRKR